MNDNFQSVFDCHPLVDEIFVVDGMPFLEAGHAQSHSVSTGKPVERVKRPAAEKPKAPEKPNAGDQDMPDADETPETPTPKKRGGKKG